MYFVTSLLLTLVALIAFCIILPGFGWGGPDSFVPGILAIWVIGVALGVFALRADREAGP
jgi:hypothetical protein